MIHAGGSSVTCLNDKSEINAKTAPTDNPMLVEKIRPVLLSSLLVNRTTKALIRINDVNTTEAISQGSVSSFHILNSGRICSFRPSRIRYPRRVVGSHGSRLFRGALHPRGNRCDDPAPFWRRRRPRQKNGAPQHHAFILLKSSLGACDPASHVKRVSLG